MLSTFSYYTLLLHLLAIDANLIYSGNETAHDAQMTTRQMSQVKSALCKVYSKLIETVNELNELKVELNATRQSLNVVRIELDRHIVQDRQELIGRVPLTTTLEKPLPANGNQVNQNITGDSHGPRRDCSSVRSLGRNISGIYRLFPDSQDKRGEMDAYCDFSSEDSWLVIQRRKDGRENFDRTYREYERGFGNLTGEFWFGNEKLHQLTSSNKYKLRIEMSDFQGSTRFAEYSIFSVDSADNSYRLTIGGYFGSAGNSLTYHNGMRFSAKDVDNDVLVSANCAANLHGAWWFKMCHASNLNGPYLGGRTKIYGFGIIWSDWHGFFYSLKSTEMKIALK